MLALKCYNGTIGNLELVECPTKAIDRFGVHDTCMNISSEKANVYSCINKVALEAELTTQMTDNQCWRGQLQFFGMVELCICDTEGCNYEARNHDLPHESSGNQVDSANPFFYVTLRFSAAFVLSLLARNY